MSNTTPNPFKALLKYLDLNPEIAGEKYILFRNKIERRLTMKGYLRAEQEELADKVLDTINKKIIEGIKIENINSYSFSILNNHLKNQARKNWRKMNPDDVSPKKLVDKQEDPLTKLVKKADDKIINLRICIEKVIKNENNRKLIIEYYDIDGSIDKQWRSELAERYGLSDGALRKKIYDWRQSLKKCIKKIRS